ncbi:PREDICTED: solute carrier family 7 member 13-like isoform X3 [Chinchilla lanigera]|uniref:solute carrier family 7 member 13-like isoform X3 n=1 Tax=Chinchilla lanigera TaxID=34839 RepID=UPI0006966833|nr:PREDICTED: solute carrier family 7 member 13-like isoform X3 [Chinchilla lanigera]
MQLSRAIGFFHGNIFLFSTTIGAGIFISPKGVLKSSSGNIPVSLSIWALCGILNIVNGLCAAETGATFPRSAAVYFLLKRTLGSCVAFLHVWIKLFGYFIGLAAQSLLVASSLIQPFYAGCSPPELPKKCLALAILWSLGLLNIRGVKTVSWFQTLSSLVKVAILCFISLAGIVLLVMGRKENVSRFESALDAELPDASQIAEAILQGFYPYVGSTVLVNIADSVAATWVDRVLPSMQWVVSLGISASVIDTSSCGILSGSRLLYAVSQEGQLPLIFSMLNEHLSPAAAVIQLTLLTSIAVIPSNMTNLLKYVGLASWALTGLTMTALIKLRYQHPDLPRPYKAWLPMIFVSLVSSAFLIFMPIIQSPKMEHIYQVVFVLSGVLYYRLHVHLNQHSVFSEKITCYLQLLFNMSPSEDQQNCISTEKHGL